MEVSPESDPFPQRWLEKPLRVIDARNALLFLEGKDETQFIAHFLQDSFYRREVVTIEIPDSYIERDV